MDQYTPQVTAKLSRVRTSMAHTSIFTNTSHLIPSDDASSAMAHSTPTTPGIPTRSSSNTTRPHSYNTRHSIKLHGACAVIDPVSGKSLEYRHLIRHPQYKKIWSGSMSNEIGRLAQGNNKVKGTNTMFFITYDDIPFDRRKDITYVRIVVDFRSQKNEKERTRITVGGNRIHYPGNVSTKTAETTTAKILFNSVISTPKAI